MYLDGLNMCAHMFETLNVVDWRYGHVFASACMLETYHEIYIVSLRDKIIWHSNWMTVGRYPSNKYR